VAALRPAGNVLEIACGTGMWTGALAAAATAVTAIDAAPEMAGIARGRVTTASVRFEVADVFSWAAAARFDTVFFAFWLSHVPASRFEQLWRQLRSLVAGHGRVLFVDEHPDVHGKEAYAAGSGEIIHRRLADGSEHRLVKVFIQPGQLQARLHQLGSMPETRWQYLDFSGRTVLLQSTRATARSLTCGGSDGERRDRDARLIGCEPFHLVTVLEVTSFWPPALAAP
jgi:2-polyprenyl-3-methyl-5-hydroxy-6-metoxy-1,4-benzoquinol methylase